MSEYPIPEPRWSDGLQGRFLRLAASGLVSARWFLPNLPDQQSLAARTGRLHIEIVSHCWNYAHMQVYQLSSLVLFPPKDVDVTMTVFYGEEDKETVELLDFFAQQAVPGVTWNWQKLPKQALFRRAIGRNLAAKQSKADWVWFTDCDLLFRDNCLDALGAALQGRQDSLVFPASEYCTGLLTPDEPLLSPPMSPPQLVDADPALFSRFDKDRATGPLQITHGDIARAVGYCESLPYYQRPSATWCKAYEDRAFRWLLRTQGTAIQVPGVYRIRHVAKGRYTGSALNTGVRSALRRAVARLKG
ncbi:glycosyltransferase family A protein [Pseudohongiella spirulinae]|uniref:Glycosyl transferase n=1 Tax=Pseudohongiella spirulinae TaxID=1249552 RepID=A0A0S2KAK2_9GAMM|nr:glycosyltransferase family A protein [Pseudohongiella spirulinae]ALO45007.1 glycosyl transferase [Pseudohongiella spirulinae]